MPILTKKLHSQKKYDEHKSILSGDNIESNLKYHYIFIEQCLGWHDEKTRRYENWLFSCVILVIY